MLGDDFRIFRSGSTPRRSQRQRGGAARASPGHHRQLLPGDGVIRPKRTVAVTAHDALTGGPADGLGVPCISGHIAILQQIVHRRPALLIEQNLGKLGTGEGILRRKLPIAVTAHQALLPDKPQDC